MLPGLAADLVLAVHLAFVLIVAFGGAAWLWWRWAPVAHLPAAAWGAYVELSGRSCPLTTLENRLLAAAGEEGYHGSFISHYLLALLYPDGLTRDLQITLAALVVALNAGIYVWVSRRRRRRRDASDACAAER